MKKEREVAKQLLRDGKKEWVIHIRNILLLSLQTHTHTQAHPCPPKQRSPHLPHTCRKAKLLLKKKRYLESLLEKTDQQLENLQQMVDNIEFTQIEMKVVEGLKTGNECLQQMHKIMSLDDVEQVMADTQEAIEYQRVCVCVYVCVCVCVCVCV